MIDDRPLAKISECGQYRYWLRRPATGKPEVGTALFCMLNPSTADATKDDPTIRRCRGFSESWRCAGIVVVNLYALRATDPKELKKHPSPVGELDSINDFYISNCGQEMGDVVCAWGKNADKDRVRSVVALFRRFGTRMYCLGTNKDGSPKHPLYVKGDTRLTRWIPPEDVEDSVYMANHMEELRASGAPMGSVQELMDSMKNPLDNV